MTIPERKISQYRSMHGKDPSASWVAVACKITVPEAERLLSQGVLFDESKDEYNKQQETEMVTRTKPTSIGVLNKIFGGIKESKKTENDNTHDRRAGGEASESIKSESSGNNDNIKEITRKNDIPMESGNGSANYLGKPGLIDRLVTKFIGGIKSFVFLSASVGDLALTVFFYISIGFDIPSKISMGIWALTQTLGKIYLWHERLDKGAIFAAALSVVATVSIVLAVADTQSIQAVANNQTEKSAIATSLENQIKAKGEENKTLQERLANTPPDYVGASKTITNTIKANDEALQSLREELNKAQERGKVIEKPKFELSTWKIFSQFTSFKWNDPSHVFAFVLILGIAVFFEILIRATTPRKPRW